MLNLVRGGKLVYVMVLVLMGFFGMYNIKLFQIVIKMLDILDCFYYRMESLMLIFDLKYCFFCFKN